jgi:hypothetical protein
MPLIRRFLIKNLRVYVLNGVRIHKLGQKFDKNKNLILLLLLNVCFIIKCCIVMAVTQTYKLATSSRFVNLTFDRSHLSLCNFHFL